jgi:hypothetical protein
MSHLRLVPPLPSDDRQPAPAYPGDSVVALAFFQAASGICLCRECSMARHPAYSAT